MVHKTRLVFMKQETSRVRQTGGAKDIVLKSRGSCLIELLQGHTKISKGKENRSHLGSFDGGNGCPKVSHQEIPKGRKRVGSGAEGDLNLPPLYYWEDTKASTKIGASGAPYTKKEGI